MSSGDQNSNLIDSKNQVLENGEGEHYEFPHIKSSIRLHFGTCAEEKETFEQNVRKILKLTKPHWVNSPQLTSKIFTDGLTNKLIGYFLENEPRDVVIFKIYGPRTEEMIDRAAEIQTMTFLHSMGLGQKLYGTFANGIMYEYIPGITLNVDSCRDPKIFPLVAAKMAQMHSIPVREVPFKNNGAFEDKVHTFVRVANEVLKNNEQIRKRYEEFSVNQNWTTSTSETLLKLIKNADMPIAFCHNDVLLANIIYDKDVPKVSFIDFEYACLNYGPFDIANHFNEFGGIEETDFSLCPDEDFKSEWIRAYLNDYKAPSELQGQNLQKKFEHWVNLCIPLSHFFWILWTVAQAQNSQINFDYIDYGKKRKPECDKWMKLNSSSVIDEGQ